MEHDRKHWEEVIRTVIERMGAHRFVEAVAYVLDEKGYRQVAERIGGLEHLAAAEKQVIHISVGRHSDD